MQILMSSFARQFVYWWEATGSKIKITQIREVVANSICSVFFWNNCSRVTFGVFCYLFGQQNKGQSFQTWRARNSSSASSKRYALMFPFTFQICALLSQILDSSLKLNCLSRRIFNDLSDQLSSDKLFLPKRKLDFSNAQAETVFYQRPRPLLW